MSSLNKVRRLPEIGLSEVYEQLVRLVPWFGQWCADVRIPPMRLNGLSFPTFIGIFMSFNTQLRSQEALCSPNGS
ncbi:MAG: hypothetical protein Ct9H300mP25_07180 [Acidobacteriota bacterium]|nr:MAG: hypothetical protein Ct9H300mP25_07180 [Acidobacteriota bacterium]